MLCDENGGQKNPKLFGENYEKTIKQKTEKSFFP